jgi:AraC-like DNA-binding protein
LRRLLITQQCSVTQAAAQLCLHERTLNRRLREQGTSFRRKLDNIRYDLARYFLGETSMSLAKIAEALAYADATGFSRAFKRWSGVTPAQWRAGKTGG